jgi:hypothetical protein
MLLLLWFKYYAAAAVVFRYAGSRPGSRVSPCWESITAPQHLLLVMCEPVHSVICYEVGGGGATWADPGRGGVTLHDKLFSTYILHALL